MLIFFLRYIYVLLINIIFCSFISIALYRLICNIELGDSLNNLNFFSIVNYPSYSAFYGIDFNIFIQYEYMHLHYCIDFVNYNYFNIVLNYIYLDSFDYTSYTYENFFKILFFTKISESFYCFNINIYFFPLQEIIYVYPNETTLVFFRILNSSTYNIECLTIYLIYPFEYNYIITKLQCFCFSNLVVNSLELVELPILFYIDSFNNYMFNKIFIFYLILLKLIN